MNILVSACLLGIDCRYDGSTRADENVLRLGERFQLVPVCPELLGGLGVPRAQSEIKDGRVLTKDGAEITKAFALGAEETLKLAKLLDCRFAVMKERSPSCGFGKIYDGTFSGRLIGGNGVAAELLSRNGIKVFGESEISDLPE